MVEYCQDIGNKFQLEYTETLNKETDVAISNLETATNLAFRNAFLEVIDAVQRTLFVNFFEQVVYRTKYLIQKSSE